MFVRIEAVRIEAVSDVTKTRLPIGVFDSGVGGLTVLQEIYRQLPNRSEERRVGKEC